MPSFHRHQRLGIHDSPLNKLTCAALSGPLGNCVRGKRFGRSLHKSDKVLPAENELITPVQKWWLTIVAIRIFHAIDVCYWICYYCLLPRYMVQYYARWLIDMCKHNWPQVSPQLSLLSSQFFMLTQKKLKITTGPMTSGQPERDHWWIWWPRGSAVHG